LSEHKKHESIKMNKTTWLNDHDMTGSDHNMSTWRTLSFLRFVQWVDTGPKSGLGERI